LGEIANFGIGKMIEFVKMIEKKGCHLFEFETYLSLLMEKRKRENYLWKIQIYRENKAEKWQEIKEAKMHKFEYKNWKEFSALCWLADGIFPNSRMDFYLYFQCQSRLRAHKIFIFVYLLSFVPEKWNKLFFAVRRSFCSRLGHTFCAEKGGKGGRMCGGSAQQRPVQKAKEGAKGEEWWTAPTLEGESKARMEGRKGTAKR
jgi:hypothetical protein